MSIYNENDRFAADWLRGLMNGGLIPAGDVDQRSIKDVQPDDLRGRQQVHLFAGIGGWSLALQLAGWPATRSVWTGSCPCQPYSAAGKGEGDSDPRNLWPEMFRLIRECRPDTVFGEQVASAIGHGWLDGVCADLEAEGYTVGAVVLGAHSVGAPHIRQRLFWVANAKDRKRRIGQPKENERREIKAGGQLLHSRLANSSESRCGGRENSRTDQIDERYGRDGVALGDTIGARPQGHAGHGGNGHQPGRLGTLAIGSTSAASWSDYIAITCRDGGKARRIPAEPALFPLVDGLPGNRVGLLRGAGNAICPQVAAEFIRAFAEREVLCA